VQYLSHDWFEAANEAVSSGPGAAADIRIGFRVLGGPAGVRSYTVVLAPDDVGFVEGIDETSVTVTLGYDVAVGIASGTTSAQRSFLDGDIRLAGDVTALLGSADDLAALDARLARLRTVTTY
jgi:hypothetical protein